MSTSKRLPYALLALCSALYFAPFLRILSRQGDEGTLMDGAARIMEGQVPFRDFFEVMGPGTFYWLALFFRLLGTTWFATRVCLLVTTVGITLLLFYLTRRLRPGLGAAPVIFFVAVSFERWNVISHHLDSTLFALLAFAALACWIDTRRTFLLFLAGAAAGLTGCFMLPKGVLLGFSFVLILALLYRREADFLPSLAALSGGCLLVAASVALFFWRSGGLGALFYANVLWPVQNYSRVNVVPYAVGFRELCWQVWTESFNVFPPVISLSASTILSIPFLVVIALPLLLALLAATQKRCALNRVTAPYWIAGAAIWASEIHRKDLSHLVFGSPLLLLLACYLCGNIRHRLAAYALQGVAACGVVLALLNPLVALVASTKVVTPRGTMYSSSPSDPVLEFLSAHVRPGEPVFLYPYAPMYYFLTGGRNPTRLSIMMYQYNTDAQFREVVRDLEQSRVRYVVWDTWFPERVKTWFPEYRHPAPEKLIVEPYLNAHYKVIGGTDEFRFLERLAP